MDATIWIAKMLLQLPAAMIALTQARYAPRNLPWLLIAISLVVIAGRP